MSLNDIKTLFQKSNRTLLILQAINLGLNFFSLISAIIIAYALSAGLLQSNPLVNQRDVALVTDTLLTPNYLFNLLVNLAFNGAILGLIIRNRIRLKKDQPLSELPYLLGYTLIAINIFADLLFIGFNVNILLQFFYLPFYVNSRRAAKLLNALR